MKERISTLIYGEKKDEKDKNKPFTKKAKKVNPIAARIEIKETSANNWWS